MFETLLPVIGMEVYTCISWLGKPVSQTENYSVNCFV